MEERKKPQNLCGAKLRGKDQTCRKFPMKGKRRCRLHGGRSISGTATINWKDGRYAKYLPTDLLHRYKAHRRDRRANDLQDEIGLLTAHIDQLLQQAHSKGSVDACATNQKIIKELQKAIEANDKHLIVEVTTRLNAAINDGMERSAVWDKIVDRLESRRRLVDTQRKYEIDMGRMLPVEQAMQFMTTLATIVRQACESHLDDPSLSRRILVQINDQFQAIFSDPVSALPSSESVHLSGKPSMT